MNFDPVKPLKGYELVMHRIKEMICVGELPPGSKLPTVVELANHFGVGRSTVREALSALKAFGWIEIRQGSGSYVERDLPELMTGDAGNLFLQAKSIKELLEVRNIAETGSASLASVNRTEEDLHGLRRILSAMENHLADETASERLDVEFHLQIAKATHNSLIVQMMESLSQRMHESMKESRRLWFYAEHATAERLLQEHRDIFTAILDQDEAKANAAMRSHIKKVEKVLQQFID
jgi:GntR family transcriptional repressor for pyruvate dehydrogenase complex